MLADGAGQGRMVVELMEVIDDQQFKAVGGRLQEGMRGGAVGAGKHRAAAGTDAHDFYSSIPASRGLLLLSIILM